MVWRLAPCGVPAEESGQRPLGEHTANPRDNIGGVDRGRQKLSNCRVYFCLSRVAAAKSIFTPGLFTLVISASDTPLMSRQERVARVTSTSIC